MPALSPTMTQGNIGGWKKKVGDAIAPGDILVEIETDKAQMEFECQEEGFLAKILLPEGTKDALVGTPLAIFVDCKEDVAKLADYQPDSASSPPPALADSAPSLQSSPSPSPSPSQSQSPSTPSPSTPLPAATPPPVVQAEGGRTPLASPLAKNMAKSMQLDLSAVAGSGPGGRIVKADVVAASVGHATPNPNHIPNPKANPTPLPSHAAGASYVDAPLTNMRKVIAKRLCESKQNIPHYYLSADVCMDSLQALRTRLNQHGAGRFKLSVNDFIVKAAARAMHDVPAVNWSWFDTFIRQNHSVDISVAVATDAGLITPIVAAADVKGLSAISAEMKELAERAREGKLRPEQYQGGTFTISNLGMLGVKSFTAIINPPQSCILAVGATEQRIVPDPTGQPVASALMTVTLSCDHRVVDGATGAQWLQYFKKYLEDPVTMLL